MAVTASRSTRSATGHSKPRVFATVSTDPEVKKRAPTKKRATTAKANTSKPRAKKVGVAKKRAPAKKAGDKVNGALLKASGAIQGKPGKKAAGTKKMKHETAAVKK